MSETAPVVPEMSGMPVPVQPSPSTPWYRASWLAVVTLVLFFPVGLVLMWVWHRSWNVWVRWGITGGFAVLVLVSAVTAPQTPIRQSIASTTVVASPSSSSRPATTSRVEALTTPRPTHAQTTTPPSATPRAVQYPPTTKADLHALAHGTSSVVHPFHSESVGVVGVCPQPKVEVTVNPNLTGEQLAADLLAYY